MVAELSVAILVNYSSSCSLFLVPYIVTMKSVLGLFFLPLTLLAQKQNPVAIECDIFIRNGKIIDGSGNSWYYGDIAVKDGKIAAVGRQLNYVGNKTIDATGLIVAPGFMDVHTHLEDDETKDPNATNFILDGVTTCITGNCGASNTDIGNYLRFIDSLKLSINVATLIGHNDVRKKVMGRANRDATPDEMEQMKSIVDKAMRCLLYTSDAADERSSVDLGGRRI